MDLKQAKAFLAECGQEHVLAHYSSLSKGERAASKSLPPA